MDGGSAAIVGAGCDRRSTSKTCPKPTGPVSGSTSANRHRCAGHFASIDLQLLGAIKTLVNLLAGFALDIAETHRLQLKLQNDSFNSRLMETTI